MTELAQRFWAKVDKSGDCWLWLASQDQYGYGRILINGRSARANRVAYELVVAPIPEGLELDHLCRNPVCVNPAHLEPVTHRENVLRGEGITAKSARKTHCSRGHPYDLFNTYIRPDGSRDCRTCHRIRGAKVDKRRRA